MNLGRFSTYNLISLIIIILFTPNLHAQGKFTVTPPVVTLNFGTFVNVNGGVVTLEPCSSSTSSDLNSNIIIINNGSSGTFEVSSTVGSSQNLTLTATPTNLSQNGTGTGSLVLSDLFVCIDGSVKKESLPFTFTLNNKHAPPVRIHMGGNLTVAKGDSPGMYTGSVSISIKP